MRLEHETDFVQAKFFFGIHRHVTSIRPVDQNIAGSRFLQDAGNRQKRAFSGT